MASVAFFVSRAINVKIKYSQHVSQITEYETKFTVTCKKFTKCHAFTNKKICEELTHAIRTSDETHGYWVDRQDVSIINDVYFIESRISTTKEIVVYFKTTLRLYAADKEVGGQVASKLAQTINDIGNNKSEIQKAFLTSILSRMKINKQASNTSQIRKNLSIIKISNLKITKNETIFLHEKVKRININQGGNTAIGSFDVNYKDSNNLVEYVSSNSNGNTNANESGIENGNGNTNEGLVDEEGLAVEVAKNISIKNGNNNDNGVERLVSETMSNAQIEMAFINSNVTPGSNIDDNNNDNDDDDSMYNNNDANDRVRNEGATAIGNEKNKNECQAGNKMVGESLMGDNVDDHDYDHDAHHVDHVQWGQKLGTNGNRNGGEKSHSQFL